jgi:transposase
MRFVETKTPEQQSCLMLHRTRHLFVRQQTAVINAIRAHLAEFGIVAPVGRHGVEALLEVVADPSDNVPSRGCDFSVWTRSGSRSGFAVPPSVTAKRPCAES